MVQRGFLAAPADLLRPSASAQGRRPDTGRTLPATAHSVGNPKVWIGGQGSGNSHPGLAGRTEVASPIGSGPSCLVGTPDRRNLPKHDLSEKT